MRPPLAGERSRGEEGGGGGRGYVIGFLENCDDRAWSEAHEGSPAAKAGDCCLLLHDSAGDKRGGR
jgi:hypothetical protein